MKSNEKHGNEFANDNEKELVKFIYKAEKKSLKRFRLFVIILIILVYFLLIHAYN